MSGLWIILVMAGIVLPLFGKFKRTMAETGSSADDTEWQQSDEQNDDGFFDFDKVEAEETVAQPQPYFTYEAPEAPVTPKAAKKATKACPKPVQQETPAYEPAFDLRQAVIYQTLLNNKYISAEN